MHKQRTVCLPAGSYDIVDPGHQEESPSGHNVFTDGHRALLFPEPGSYRMRGFGSVVTDSGWIEVAPGATLLFSEPLEIEWDERSGDYTIGHMHLETGWGA